MHIHRLQKQTIFYHILDPDCLYHSTSLEDRMYDFGNANLFNDFSNTFFLTMFDVSEEQIQFAFLQLYQTITAKKLSYHHKDYTFDIHCGVYTSHAYISPHDFFMLSQEQFQNTMQHQSLISIKALTYPRVAHIDNKSV
ncbi:MAG: hypothetical protein RR585_14755 [Coprobacillus sp.]